MSYAKFLLVSLGILVATFSALSLSTRMAEIELAGVGIVLGVGMVVVASRMR